MSKVAVIYWSGTGNTEIMANSIADGAKNAGNDVDVFTSAEFDSSMVDDYEKLAFGCPSMGAEVLEEAEFQPMWDEVKDSLSGKTVVLFGSYGWGDGEWMRNWEAECSDLGLSVETLMLNETPDDDGKEECENFGKNL